MYKAKTLLYTDAYMLQLPHTMPFAIAAHHIGCAGRACVLCCVHALLVRLPMLQSQLGSLKSLASTQTICTLSTGTSGAFVVDLVPVQLIVQNS